MEEITCPNCRQRVEPIPVLYGYPIEEAWDAEKRGELVIGGCVPDLGPDAVCPNCRQPIAMAGGDYVEPTSAGAGD